MQNNRLQSILQMLEKSPSDPFLHYALALEYEAAGLDNMAVVKYEYLLQHYSNYLPLYYQYGSLLSRQRNYDEALKILGKGITLATVQKNQKTLRELREAYSILEDEME